MIFDQLKCGNCGNDKLTLFNLRPRDEGSDYFRCVEIRCGCGVKTHIRASADSTRGIILVHNKASEWEA